MKLSYWLLLTISLALASISGASAAEIREYLSPNGLLNARVIPLPNAPYGEGESLIEVRSANGELLLSKSYASEDGEHGFGVVNAAWSQDSTFFVYSLTSSGGHQSWHSPIEFAKTATRSIHRLDDCLGPITSSDFTLLPPDIIKVVARKKEDLAETSFEVRLPELACGAK